MTTILSEKITLQPGLSFWELNLMLGFDVVGDHSWSFSIVDAKQVYDVTVLPILQKEATKSLLPGSEAKPVWGSQSLVIFVGTTRYKKIC